MKFSSLFLIGAILLLFSALAQENPMEEVTTPAWLQTELIDASTGESFTLADFEGKTVYVEPFATWCGNCHKQLDNVKAAKAQLLATGDTDAETTYAFVIVSLEGNISNEALMEYAKDKGFDFTFAVVNTELLQGLVGDFGRAVTSPPSTPHFIIRPDGSNTALESGQVESTEELVEQLLAASQDQGS